MSKTKLEEPPEPIRLTEGCVIDGVYFLPGAVLPYATEAEVPPNLKHLIAAGESEIPPPLVRSIYGTPQPQPEPVYYVFDSQHGRGARQIVQGWHDEDESVEFLNRPLAPEIEEALRASHSKHIDLTRAQLQFNQGAIDTAYATTATDVEPRVQRFARRGSVFTQIEKIELEPGEPIFIQHRGGNHEIIGYTDVNAEPPELPIRT